MAYSTAITLAALAARAASGTGAQVDLVQATTARLTLNVTAASGTTPQLTVTVNTSPDGIMWTPLGTFATLAVPGSQYLPLPGASRYVQLAWTITGAGASFTFSVTGLAVVVYVTPADLALFGAPGDVLADVSAADLDRYSSASTDYASSLISNQYELPLLHWEDDLREAVSSLVTWSIMSRRLGFNVEDPTDSAFKINRDAARSWLNDVGEGVAQLAGVIDSASPIDVGGAEIYSDSPRGWNR